MPWPGLPNDSSRRGRPGERDNIVSRLSSPPVSANTHKRRASDVRPPSAWSRSRQWLFAPLVLLVALVAGRYLWPASSGESAHDGAPAWSPDGRLLAFSVETKGQTDIYVMGVEGTERRALTSTSSQDGAPAFSPDGKSIAFESDRDGNPEIYVMDVSGAHVRRLTNSMANDRAPAWSPDGRRIAFLSDRDDAVQADVFTMNAADGADVRRLTTDGGHWTPQYSPDGSRIAVQRGHDLYLVDVAGGASRRLTFEPRNGMSPTWAPDGRRLAFTSTRNQRLELFTMAVDGGGQELLVQMPGASAMDPRWSPDGRRIAFVYVPKLIGAAPGADQPYGISVVDLATRKVTRLSP